MARKDAIITLQLLLYCWEGLHDENVLLSLNKVSAYGGYEYKSDEPEEIFLQMCEEFNGLNKECNGCNKECLVTYWGQNFLIFSTKINCVR